MQHITAGGLTMWPFTRKSAPKPDPADKAVKALTARARAFAHEMGGEKARDDLDKAIDKMLATSTHKAVKP